jgi:uncharacterized membrane protein
MSEGTTPREPGEEGRQQPGWGPSGSPDPSGPPPGWGAPRGPQQPGTTGMPENTASGLAYLATFVTGAIFFVLDRRPEVRFHAMQSILFGAVWLVVWVLRQAIGVFPLDLVLYLAWLAGLIIWVVLLIQGFSGNHFKLPFIGDLAEQQTRRTF